MFFLSFSYHLLYCFYHTLIIFIVNNILRLYTFYLQYTMVILRTSVRSVVISWYFFPKIVRNMSCNWDYLRSLNRGLIYILYSTVFFVSFSYWWYYIKWRPWHTSPKIIPWRNKSVMIINSTNSNISSWIRHMIRIGPGYAPSSICYRTGCFHYHFHFILK